MTETVTADTPPFSAFEGPRRIASGALATVAEAARQAARNGREPVLIFDDRSGATVEIDLRGSAQEMQSRLRKLVEEARRSHRGRDRRRARHEAAYRFMSVMAGNLPGYEEASRALFADDPRAFATHAAAWPDDIRAQAGRLGFDRGPEGNPGD